METNTSNKGVIVAVIIGIIIVGISIGLIVFNDFKPEETVAPNANPNTNNTTNNNNNTGNNNNNNQNSETKNEENNNGSSTNGENNNPSTEVKDPNSIANLTNKYPNATSAELEKIREIRIEYNNASDTIIVEKLLDKKDEESACIFLKKGNPNISTILADNYNKYYIGLVGTGCLSTAQQKKLEDAREEQNVIAMEKTKELIGSMAVDACYAKTDAAEITGNVTLKFTEIGIGEITGLPLINLVTDKEVDLEKSTVVYTNRCKLQSVNIVDK